MFRDWDALCKNEYIIELAAGTQRVHARFRRRVPIYTVKFLYIELKKGRCV